MEEDNEPRSALLRAETTTVETTAANNVSGHTPQYTRVAGRFTKNGFPFFDFARILENTAHKDKYTNTNTHTLHTAHTHTHTHTHHAH